VLCFDTCFHLRSRCGAYAQSMNELRKARVLSKARVLRLLPTPSLEHRSQQVFVAQFDTTNAVLRCVVYDAADAHTVRSMCGHADLLNLRVEAIRADGLVVCLQSCADAGEQPTKQTQQPQQTEQTEQALCTELPFVQGGSFQAERAEQAEGAEYNAAAPRKRPYIPALSPH